MPAPRLKVRYPNRRDRIPLYRKNPTSPYTLVISGESRPNAQVFTATLAAKAGEPALFVKVEHALLPGRPSNRFGLVAKLYSDAGFTTPAALPAAGHTYDLTVMVRVPPRTNPFTRTIPNVKFRAGTVLAALEAFPDSDSQWCNDGFVAYGFLPDQTHYPVLSAKMSDTSQPLEVGSDTPCTDPDLFWFAVFPTIPDGVYDLNVVTNAGSLPPVTGLEVDSDFC